MQDPTSEQVVDGINKREREEVVLIMGTHYCDFLSYNIRIIKYITNPVFNY